MTPGVPWQIKGVSRQTRDAAHEAARRAGISVGEWLDRVVLDLALRDGVDPRRLAQPRYDPYEAGSEEDVRPSCGLDRAIETLREALAKINLTLQEATTRKAFHARESERDALRPLAESLLGMAQAVQQLSQKIAKLIQKLDASDARLDRFEAIERGLAELLIHLARQRVPNLAPAPPPPAVDALSRDIADLRQTEKKTQSSLEVIHDALRHVVDRLSMIETNMRGKVATPPDALSPPALELDWLAPAAPTARRPPFAPEETATPATAESASTASPASTPAALPARPIDPGLPRDGLPEFDSVAARGHEPASPADHILASVSALGGAKLSVIPDRSGRSDFIAAARRATQAPARDVAMENDASAAIKTALAGGGPASGIGKLRALIGGTTTILIVLGLLQIARIVVGPSDETKLTLPSHAAVSPVPAPASANDPASPVPPERPQPPRPIVSVIDGAAVATPGNGILVPMWTPEHQSEAAGQVQASPGGRSGAAAATAASTPASAKSAPSAVGHNLATPRPAQ